MGIRVGPIDIGTKVLLAPMSGVTDAPFRRLARHAPALTWTFTLMALLTTGVMLVRGADGIDPSDAWRRCCR